MREQPTNRSVVIDGYGRCAFNSKGYLRIRSGPLRDQYLHRAVWERTAGLSVPAGFQVHHMGSKRCWCSHNLVALAPELHLQERRRDPYTGEFMSKTGWEQRYGIDNSLGF